MSRTVLEVMPPNVSYRLTPMGESLLEAAGPLLRWSGEHLPLLEAARTEYDQRD